MSLRPCKRWHAANFSMSLRGAPLHPRTRPSFCMSLRASAHTGVAIRSPRMETWPVGTTLGKSVALPRIRLRRCSLLCAAAGDADCHVASLLAMTCRRRAGVSIGNCVVPWQIRHAFRVRPKYCFLPCTAAGDADCHVAPLLAMTVGKRPCTRVHVLPSACHCEPVRTLAWQSVLPAWKPGQLALL